MRKIIIIVFTILVVTLPVNASLPEHLVAIQSRQAMPLIFAIAQSAHRRPLSVRAHSLKEKIAHSPDSHPLINCDCEFTADELDKMFIKEQSGYGAVYYRLQGETGLCPLWNAAIDAAESGHFTVLSAPGNVSGFGFNGKSYMSFASIEACVEHKSRFMADNYLTPGGKYYNGVSLSAVCKRYNGWDSWCDLVTEVAYYMLVRGERAA